MNLLILLCKSIVEYMRDILIYIDQEVVTTHFLSLYRLIGHPNADNIYNGIMEVIGSNGFDLPLEWDTLQMGLV